jgi:hypothetical protein
MWISISDLRGLDVCPGVIFLKLLRDSARLDLIGTGFNDVK